MTRASFAPHPHRDGEFTCYPLADRRVSFAEQQDLQVPVGEPSTWLVVLLGLSPLLTIALVLVVASLIR